MWGHRRGGGLRQINNCRKVPLQVHFFRGRQLALVTIKLFNPPGEVRMESFVCFMTKKNDLELEEAVPTVAGHVDQDV